MIKTSILRRLTGGNPHHIAAIILAISVLAGILVFLIVGGQLTTDVILSFFLGIAGTGTVVVFAMGIRSLQRVRERSPWLYASTGGAIEEYAVNIPEVEEVIFVGYISKMLSENLRALRRSWRIKKMRLLLRDLDSVDPKAEGELPNSGDSLNKRVEQGTYALEDILDGAGQHRIDHLEVHHTRSIPCLRAFIVKFKDVKGHITEVGFVSFYKKREHGPGKLDLSARNSPVLRLSRENRYEEALLQSFLNWFEFIWESGSREGESLQTDR